MSDIDWSKAPEWANHAVKSKDSYSDSFAWIKELEIGSKIQWKHQSFVYVIDDPKCLKIIESRPVKQPWNGEGLPPVGVEVELIYPQGQWLKVVVLYYDDAITLIKRTTGTNKYRIINHINSAEFRPIRTEEEKAIDDMSKILAMHETKIIELASDPKMFTGLAKSLYKSGYRKQEAAE